jgi:hypothetical protein
LVDLSEARDGFLAYLALHANLPLLRDHSMLLLRVLLFVMVSNTCPT